MYHTDILCECQCKCTLSTWYSLIYYRIGWGGGGVEGGRGLGSKIESVIKDGFLIVIL